MAKRRIKKPTRIIRKAAHKKVYSSMRMPFVILAIAGMIVSWILILNPSSLSVRSRVNTPTVTPIRILQRLPAGWTLSQKTAADVIIQATKKPYKEYVPTVILGRMKVDAKDLADPKSYVDRTIQGARSTIPTLLIVNNTESKKDGFYMRIIEGTYTEGSRRIGITQYILVDDQDFFMTAGSYLAEDTRSQKEIPQIFQYFYETALTN